MRIKLFKKRGHALLVFKDLTEMSDVQTVLAQEMRAVIGGLGKCPCVVALRLDPDAVPLGADEVRRLFEGMLRDDFGLNGPDGEGDA